MGSLKPTPPPRAPIGLTHPTRKATTRRYGNESIKARDTHQKGVVVVAVEEYAALTLALARSSLPPHHIHTIPRGCALPAPSSFPVPPPGFSRGGRPDISLPTDCFSQEFISRPPHS